MSLYRQEHICDYLPQKFSTQSMATHGEPANVSYLSHTELRIHELTFRILAGKFRSLSSYHLKIKRELVQRKPTKSRQSFSVHQGALQAAIQPVLFSVVLFFELAFQCCQSPAVQSSWTFAVRCFLTLGVIGT